MDFDIFASRYDTTPDLSEDLETLFEKIARKVVLEILHDYHDFVACSISEDFKKSKS